MTIPAKMTALLQLEDGYTKTPSGTVLEAMDPYVRKAEIDVPEPAPGQVLIDVSLASINPSDVMFIKGMYGQPRAKDRPAGFEGVGTVVKSGGDPIGDQLVGKRVAFAAGPQGSGTWANYAVGDSAGCIPLIDGVRDEDGAAMIVNPLTAMAMFDIVKEEGEKAFIITAGASQLCKLLISIAKDEGYRPIAIVRRDEQIKLLEDMGAAHVLNADADGYVEKLAAVLREEKPRIFLDAVTGPQAAQIFTLMPKRARWIIYGKLDPNETPIHEPGQMIFMHKKIEGFWLTSWMMNTPMEKRVATITDVQKRFASGQWQTDVTAIVPLDEAMERVPEELAKPNGKVFISGK